MELPSNAARVIADFKDLDTERKAEIVKHLALTPDTRAHETINTLISNGGPEGRLVSEIFDRRIIQPGDSPVNKAMSPSARK